MEAEPARDMWEDEPPSPPASATADPSDPPGDPPPITPELFSRRAVFSPLSGRWQKANADDDAAAADARPHGRPG